MTDTNDKIYGNRLIAAFMDDVYALDRGWIINFIDKPALFETTNSFEADELMYDKSWDWIMPVVIKINEMGKQYHLALFKTYYSMSVEKGGKMHKDFSFAHAVPVNPADPVKPLFDLIVKFIIWYNEQKTHDTDNA